MPRWLDAHTHLDSDELFAQKEDLLDRARQAEVERILLVNSEATEVSFERTLLCLQLSHPVRRYACFGVHPHQASLYDDAMERRLRELLRHDNVVAVGECGLDFYYNYSPQNVQITALEKQLTLAREEKLPVVIHCRDAYTQLAEILSRQHPPNRGMIHCFTGTREEMKPLLDLGFFISFSGIVTFRKSTELQECAKFVPLDRILIETDAPFLSPVPHRGKRNEPSFVAETGKLIASLRGLPEEVLSAAIFSNFENLLT
jgi:TatD DNase family protein